MTYRAHTTGSGSFLSHYPQSTGPRQGGPTLANGARRVRRPRPFRETLPCGGYRYADDLVSTARSLPGLQRHADIISAFALCFDMEISVPKLRLAEFGPRPPAKPPPGRKRPSSQRLRPPTRPPRLLRPPSASAGPVQSCARNVLSTTPCLQRPLAPSCGHHTRSSSPRRPPRPFQRWTPRSTCFNVGSPGACPPSQHAFSTHPPVKMRKWSMAQRALT